MVFACSRFQMEDIFNGCSLLQIIKRSCISKKEMINLNVFAKKIEVFMNFFRVLKNYYWVQLAIAFITVGTIGAILIGLGKVKTDTTLFYTFIVFAVMGAVLLFVQFKKIGNLFKSGLRVAGTVTGSTFYKDRGSISYVYSVEGEDFKGKMAVGRNRETRALKEGMSVNILVDEVRFNKSVIENLLK